LRTAKKLAGGSIIEQKIRISHFGDESVGWQNSGAPNRSRNLSPSTPQFTTTSTKNDI
jgi:hypothetical protein